MHLVDITMFYAAEGGGVSTYLNAKARWLARRSRIGHTIVSSNVHGGGRAPALAEIPAMRVPGIHGYRVPRSVAAPARILCALQPDLVEVGDAGHCAWAALRTKRALGIPAVAFYHSDLPRLMANRFGELAMDASRHYLARLYRQFDMVLAPSRLMVQQLSAMGIAGAVHQPLGIDVEVFRPQRRIDTLRQHLHLPADTRLLVYAGRFTVEKKLDVLIEAVRKLGRPYHLVLVGGGAVLPRFPQISHIPFKRDQRVLARLLASCDLMVHPGDCETFGLIALEAMACGLPVVATGGGVAELVDEHTGLLVRPNSADSLAEGIAAMFARDLAVLGANARRKAQEQYDWNLIMPQLLNRYGGLLAKAQRAEFDADRVCAAD
ncbi:MAG: glycosyltransferase [Pseudomonadota bacterium]|nr:glycosyltransferase [Pseudomonadota bacterium]